MLQKKRGRKSLLGGFKTTYKIQKESIQWVLKYFYQHNVKDIFKRGNLSYGVEGDSIKIYYRGKTDVFLDFKIELGNRRRADELRILIQDFIVDLYFEYEWDGSPLGNNELARLFGFSEQAMMITITKIKKKMKDKGGYLLES